jgi:hypothetical protein
MKKLVSLKFKSLPFSAHYDFFMKLSLILSSSGDTLKIAVAGLMDDFNSWLAKEDAVIQWIRKSVLTDKIADADGQIDRLLVGINSVVKAFIHSTIPDAMAAANRVQIMLNQYGRVTRESYDEEAGKVRAMLEQYRGAYYADVNTLGLQNWVNELSAAFDIFESLLGQRESEQGAKPTYTAQKVRQGIEEVYQQMVEIINANCIVNVSRDFSDFIDLLNPDIERLNAEFQKAKKDLGKSNQTFIDPVKTQVYTGKPVTPLPTVYYNDKGKDATTQLALGRDFSVTYHNNISIGIAELIVHGKGQYKGSKTVTFLIEEGADR